MYLITADSAEHASTVIDTIESAYSYVYTQVLNLIIYCLYVYLSLSFIKNSYIISNNVNNHNNTTNINNSDDNTNFTIIST